jgi:hypothetical protein
LTISIVVRQWFCRVLLNAKHLFVLRTFNLLAIVTLGLLYIVN